LNPQQYTQSVYAVKHACYTHCGTKGVNPLHCVKSLFDPVFSAPALVQMSMSYLLIRQTEPAALMHMLSLVCIARDVFFFFWESACDQYRANQHCPDRGQGFCILLEAD
ncbi:unnamed protein product, partial [Staurois parvus]